MFYTQIFIKKFSKKRRKFINCALVNKTPSIHQILVLLSPFFHASKTNVTEQFSLCQLYFGRHGERFDKFTIKILVELVG